jgi:hypothetical protein
MTNTASFTHSISLYVYKDMGDDWEIIFKDKVYQTSGGNALETLTKLITISLFNCEFAGVSKAQWLPWSLHCINSHLHSSDCAQANKTHIQRLRRSRSLSSVNTEGVIQEPIVNRLHNKIWWCYSCSESSLIHPALRKPCLRREHHILRSIEWDGCIPWEDVDFCLSIIDY